jgi:hypothetical protein
MSDPQHNEKTDVAAEVESTEADVQITEGGSGGTDEAVIPPIGRPPLAKIFYAVLAVIATAMLWSTAGAVNKQACIQELSARYPTLGLSARSASLNANTLKSHLKSCSGSPF